MEKVHIYIDGPNLLGAVSDLRKKRLWIDPILLSGYLVDTTHQSLNRVFYAETPYPQNLHSPETFRSQQSFFGKIYSHIQDQRLVHIRGNYRVNTMTVPSFIVSQLKPEIRTLIESISWKKPTEKGGDVGLAVQLVRDAFQGEFDRAILVTADQDFAPAVNIVVSEAKKKMSVAYVHNSYRNAVALRNRCSETEFIQITRKMIEQCVLE
ncbi:MAG: NYN domain-containing protein [Candidatus Omnitrophica bacterium]|nr:NYN domain-containing protein [Candidatus Omnitrophota bacterium]